MIGAGDGPDAQLVVENQKLGHHVSVEKSVLLYLSQLRFAAVTERIP